MSETIDKPSAAQRMRRIATATIAINQLSHGIVKNNADNAQAKKSFLQIPNNSTNSNNNNSTSIKSSPGNQPPACLSKVLAKISKEEKLLSRNYDFDQRSMVNDKLLHPLILTGIDMEELAANHRPQNKGEDDKKSDQSYLKHDYKLQGKTKERINQDTMNFKFEFSVRSKSQRTIDEQPTSRSVDKSHTDKVKDLIYEYEQKLVLQAKEHRKKQKDLAKEREKELLQLESHHKRSPHGKDKHREGNDDDNVSVNSRLSLEGVKDRKRRKQLYNLDNEFVPMKQETARKYFGEEARVHFFDMYQKMSQQSKLLAPHGANSSYLQLESNQEEDDEDDDEVDEMVTNTANSSRISSPLASTRSKSQVTPSTMNRPPRRRLIDDESLATGFSWSRLVDDADNNNNPVSSTQRGRHVINLSPVGDKNAVVSESLLSRSNGFYEDLQAFSSNDYLKQSIDRDLLSVPSFGLYDKAPEDDQSAHNGYNPHSSSMSSLTYGIAGDGRKYTRGYNQIKQTRKICLTPLDLNRSRQQRDDMTTINGGLEQNSYYSLASTGTTQKGRKQSVKNGDDNMSVGSHNSSNNNGFSHSNDRQKKLSSDDSIASNFSQHGGTAQRGYSVVDQDKKRQNPNKHINLHNLAEDLKSKSSLMTIASRPVSARTKYIAGCLREGLKPLPNIIIRKDFTTVLDLSHYLMGDEMGKVLAECLADLPHIESIDLNDNLLMDPSLSPLITTIATMSSLKSLNLSRNKIDGDSSDALAEFVSRSDCPLISLILQNADVDDDEADAFVQCLVSNGRLKELDLSSNLLGTAEGQSNDNNDNATMKDNNGSSKSDKNMPRTGGIAIAEFIRSENCQLRSLKLAWNSIHGYSAEKLASALIINRTLTYLDLSNNGLGYKAGELLGDAVMENRTLQTLMISGNYLTATSTVCICMGIVENQALHRVEMNENPVGQAGVKMIMQVSFNIGPRIHLHAKNCNVNAHDTRCFYDPGYPMGDYALRLSQPFDRAVAFHLLYIAATHASYIFQSSSYELAGKSRNLKFIQIIAKDREQFFDAEQKKIIEGLRLLHSAASNTKLATKLFYEADEDHSGKLDKDELQTVLDTIGFSIDEDRLNDILAVFDVDGAGTIDLQEFISLLKSQQREAAMRIKDMIEYPILALASEPTQKYVPPKKGILRLSLVDGFVQKSKFYTLSAVDQRYAHNMARDIIGDSSVVAEAVKHNRLRYDEAINTFKVLVQEQGDKAKTLQKILPNMMFASESRQLLSKVTKDNRLEIIRIKMAFGVTLRPMLGSYNGYYCLDLSKELHRICLSKLLLQSQTLNHGRQQNSFLEGSKVGDVSQHGNWSCFRNEVFNDEHFVITPQRFTPMPETGILSFDFSGSNRPTGGELKLTDKRLCKVLQNLCLLPVERTSEAMHRLGHWKKKTSEMSRDGSVFMPAYQFTVDKAVEVSTFMDEFYENILERDDLIKKGMKKEEMSGLDNKDEEVHDTNNVHSDSSDDEADNNGSNNQSVDVSATNSVNGDDEDTFVSTVDGNESTNSNTKTKQKFGLADGLGKETISQENTKSLSVVEQRKRKIAEQKRRLQKILFSNDPRRKITIPAKARRLIEAIDETFCQLWIYSRHLAMIIVLFQDMLGTPARSKFFGSYCAEIVIDLFSRVVDMHNFEVVLEVLNARDCAAIFCRLGMLNIFNPMKPEVTMELQIGRREERVVAKMIVYLSVIEPGLNLIFKQFRWKRDMDIIPGWDVTESWCTEEGLSPHGYFAFTYYSGEGKNKAGCFPDVMLRKALTSLVLIDENEVIAEDDIISDEPVNTGQLHFMQYKDIWISYLSL